MLQMMSYDMNENISNKIHKKRLVAIYLNEMKKHNTTVRDTQCDFCWAVLPESFLIGQHFF